MAIKLGEMLLKEKMITAEQLDDALKSQVIFGIKLGSSLIELGFIDDEELSLFLGRKLGVPSVSKEELMSIPAEVIKKIPAALAEKHHAIPVRINNKSIAVAMIDPADFQAIDQLAFATGFKIEPHIAPEVHISFALERYYGVKRDMRYLRVSGRTLSRPRAKTEQQDVITPVKPAEAAPSVSNPAMEANENFVCRGEDELLNIQFPTEFAGFGSLPDLPEQEPDISSYTVDRLSIDFASAKSRDQIADVFIKYLGQEFEIGALFIIRNNMAVGWRGISSGKSIDGFSNFSMLLSKPSVIRDVIDTQRFAMGSLIQTPENAQILKALAVSTGTPLLVLPIVMLKKVVAAVIVSAEMDALGKRLLELQKLVYKASLAFEMLIIKNKILMT